MLHIVLHQPEIPDNAGNVGRTCVALGAKLWLVRPLGFQLDDRHLRRAGLDYWQHLDWEAVDDWAALLNRLGQTFLSVEKSGGQTLPSVEESGGQTFLSVAAKDRQECLSSLNDRQECLSSCGRFWFLTKRATRVYTEAEFVDGDALVFGSESRGLPESLIASQPDRCLRIPMQPEARSLNLSVSVGIAAYEARRQIFTSLAK